VEVEAEEADARRPARSSARLGAGFPVQVEGQAPGRLPRMRHLGLSADELHLSGRQPTICETLV
jgi:hypothetical protein